MEMLPLHEGTDIWMAPEIKQTKTYGHPADVYGFGLIAMFIKTGCLPSGKPRNENYSGT